jgi:hypothetical protein
MLNPVETEFHEIPSILWNFPWNSIEFHGIPLTSVHKKNSMEISMEFHGKFHGITLVSIEFSMEFHGENIMKKSVKCL